MKNMLLGDERGNADILYKSIMKIYNDLLKWEKLGRKIMFEIVGSFIAILLFYFLIYS